MIDAEQLSERLRKAGHPVNEITGATDESGAAATLGCSERTLANWRDEGTGPECWRSPRWWYSLAGLIEFLESRKSDATR